MGLFSKQSRGGSPIRTELKIDCLEKRKRPSLRGKAFILKRYPIELYDIPAFIRVKIQELNLRELSVLRRQQENNKIILKLFCGCLLFLTLFAALVAGAFYGISHASGEIKVKEWPSRSNPFEK